MQKHLAILLCALALCHTAHVHAAPTRPEKTEVVCPPEYQSSKSWQDCLFWQRDQFVAIKAALTAQIRQHLRHRTRVLHLFNQEEQAWERYVDTASSIAYDKYIDGSIRNTIHTHTQNSLLILRIQLLENFLHNQSITPRWRLLNGTEDHDQTDTPTHVYDFRCPNRSNWYACARAQRQQLQPLIQLYHRQAFDSDNLSQRHIRQEAHHWQAYHRAARNFGTAMWHNRYAGEVWANHAIKSRIYAFNVWEVSNESLPQPIIKLD